LALTLNTYNAAQFMPIAVGAWIACAFFRQKMKTPILQKYFFLNYYSSQFLLFPLGSYAINHWDQSQIAKTIHYFWEIG